MAAVAQQVLQQTREKSQGFDGWTLAAVLLLVSIGVVMVASSSIGLAMSSRGGSPTMFLMRESEFVALGLVMLVAGAAIDYRWLQRCSKLAIMGSIFLLMAVLVVGTSSNGAQRWFQVSSWQFQPSELAKLAVAIYFAHWLSSRRDRITHFTNCSMPFGIILGFVCMLILAEPDMGTAVVVAIAMIAVYFVAGANIKHLIVGFGAAFGVAILMIWVVAYRSTRFDAWLHPDKYPQGAGYHIMHALYALGSGGLTGVGLGNSIQKWYLPAPATDTIFAVLAEEQGFLGSVVVLGLFVLLAYRGLRIAQSAPDEFGRLLATGITALIAFQAMINIAVVSNTLPFTGVPLPFISYGGSSLVVSMLSAGILLSISRRSHEVSSTVPEQHSNPGGSDSRRHHRRKDWRPRLSGGGRRRATPSIAQSRQHSKSRRGTGLSSDLT